MESKERFFWFLVSGEVIYETELDGKTVQTSIRINGITKSKEKTVSVRGLAKAQEAIQINFMKLMGETKCNIIGVVLYAISPLGFMADSEFHNMPLENVAKEV